VTKQPVRRTLSRQRSGPTTPPVVRFEIDSRNTCWPCQVLPPSQPSRRAGWRPRFSLRPLGFAFDHSSRTAPYKHLNRTLVWLRAEASADTLIGGRNRREGCLRPTRTIRVGEDGRRNWQPVCSKVPSLAKIASLHVHQSGCIQANQTPRRRQIEPRQAETAWPAGEVWLRWLKILRPRRPVL
jgi:hypothetical protein